MNIFLMHVGHPGNVDIESTVTRRRGCEIVVAVLAWRRKKVAPSRPAMWSSILFGESFYEYLHALMDEQIAEMMKEPKFRRMIEELNARMFEAMAEIARKHISGDKQRALVMLPGGPVGIPKTIPTDS